MPLINSITSSDIERLDQAQLVTLLRILLACEARDQIAATHVPNGITVGDDGEDGRWDGPAVPPNIPNPFTVFQVKASDFGPADCYNEIFVIPPPKAKVKKAKVPKSPPIKLQAKPIWKEIEARKGTFIFFCHKGAVQSGGDGKKGIAGRLTQARMALKECGVTVTASQLDFFDGNKIAAWANKFIAAIIFVHECQGKLNKRRGRTWREWKRDETVRWDYCSNEILDAHIETIRNAISKPGQIARVSGLSGLGKTRLAFEVFRPPIPEAGAWKGNDLARGALAESVVYLDAEHSADEVTSALEDYDTSTLSGTIVVDNCERSHHNLLAKIVKRLDCKISLLTLDYEPESSFPGEASILLDPLTMEPLVFQILKTHPKVQPLNLPDHTLQRISNMAQGFPFFAIVIAEIGDAVSLEHLTQLGLVKKLISGHGPEDPEALKVLTALSLFRHVGTDGTFAEQAEFVRSTFCPTVAADDFQKIIKKFQKKRIIQTAGYHVLVAPLPLAAALAADWWDRANMKKWDEILPLIEKQKMIETFSERLKQLHFSPNASALAEQLCGPSGPFSKAKLLNSKSGSQLFRAIVELNPIAAAGCIHRVFAGKGPKTIRDVVEGRRNLVWGLEKLCWGKDTFDLAAEVMLDFAAAEVENYTNNASGQFCQLFQIYLAGTQTPARDRLRVIRAGLDSGIAEKRKVCIKALAAALQSHQFTRSGGVEVRGSGLPEKDWEPADRNEVFEYWQAAAELLTAIALSKAPDAADARKALGRRLRSIIWSPTVGWLEPLVLKIASKSRNYWPEALESIKLSIGHDKDHHTPGSLRRVESWVEKLTPSAPADRLRQIVTEAPHEHREQSSGSWVDVAAEKAEALAEELAKKPASLTKLLPPLFKGDQRQAVAFGMKLGALGYRRNTFIQECLAILKKVPPEEQNPNLLGGYLRELNDRKAVTETLDTIAKDGNLRGLVPALTRFVHPQKADLERVVRLISADGVNPNVLRNFAYGSVLNDTAPSDLIEVLEPLTDRLKDARPIVIELLHLYVHHDKPKWQACARYIRKLIALPGVIALCQNSSVSFAIEEFTKALLEPGQDTELARLLSTEIIAANDKLLTLGTDPFVTQILQIVLNKYPQVAWPLLGNELIAGRSIRFLVGRNLTTGVNPMEQGKILEATGSLLDAVPSDVFLDWAKKHPDQVYKLLDLASLFVQEEKTGEFEWSDTAARLVKIRFDEKCERAIGNSLASFGSEGSRVPYIERRIRLLAKWANHSNPKVRGMVRRQTQYLEADKKREAVQDAHFAVGIRHN